MADITINLNTTRLQEAVDQLAVFLSGKVRDMTAQFDAVAGRVSSDSGIQTDRICAVCRCKFAPHYPTDTLCLDCDQRSLDYTAKTTPEEAVIAKQAHDDMHRLIALSERVAIEIMDDDIIYDKLYAIDLNLTQQVIDRLYNRGFSLTISRHKGRSHNGKFCCHFVRWTDYPDPFTNFIDVSGPDKAANTMAEAICLAALAAVQEEAPHA